MISLKEYLDQVARLTGTKQKMNNPVTRALYEEKSVEAGHWLSVDEFNATLGI